MSHGGAQPSAPVRKAAQGAPAPGDYRNVLRAPAPQETCAWPGEGEAAEARLNRLATALADPAFWTAPVEHDGEGPAPWAADENPGMPAGYVYLYQLAAHDLLQTTLGFPALEPGDPAQLRNLRTLRFDLDTLYGRGPGGDPAAYAIESANDALRVRFRLGLGAPDEAGRPYGLAARPAGRDIGRGLAATAEAGPRAGATDPLVADPRNDDNGIVSQVSVLFMLAHGALYDAVFDAMPETDPDTLAPRPRRERHEAAFAATRMLVERLWRRVLRRDLAPRLLDPAVLPLMADGSLAALDPQGAMPLELSHAALRSAHMMSRSSYRFRQGARPKSLEEVLRQSSGGLAARLPATGDWIAQWSCFFETNPHTPPQLARRLGPSQPKRMDKPWRRLPEDPGDRQETLARTDQVRGARAALWKAEALIQALAAAAPALAAVPGLEPGAQAAEARTRRVRDWLARRTPHPLSQADADALAEDPPLKLFLEIEAAALRGGQGYGPLGSALVGGLFAAALPDETPEAEALAGRLAQAAPGHAETFEAFEAASDMPALLRWLAPRVAPARGLPFL